MMVVYGIEACPNCVEAKERLNREHVSFEYREIGSSVAWLKAFVNLREGNAHFDDAREHNYIGIPYFVFEDGYQTMDISEALAKMKEYE